VVIAIEPPLAGVSAKVIGGDTFLEVSVARGHEVVVMGYQGEPYIRISKDGTVERNRRSAATYLNESRYGRVTVPAIAKDPNAAPDWERIGSGGSYAWHDHRIHWMLPDPPPNVKRGDEVKDVSPWKAPITVDGKDATIIGRLTYAKSTSPVPWVGLGIVAAVALVLVGRRAPVLVSAAALLVLGTFGTVLGWNDFAQIPAGAGANPLVVGLPALGAVAGLVGMLARRSAIGVIAVLAGVASVLGWGLLQYEVLLRPVLPTTYPFAVDRAGVALAIGGAIAAAWLAVTSGMLALPELPDD
jgi:hypothetical protein